MRQALTRFLELDEHIVELAGSGREAMAKLQDSAPFDLVITDRAMPEMGGDELAASEVSSILAASAFSAVSAAGLIRAFSRISAQSSSFGIGRPNKKP